jgi:uncharacterized membrane protein YeaQ/YmgE (transglycosylase-associated protein family)
MVWVSLKERRLAEGIVSRRGHGVSLKAWLAEVGRLGSGWLLPGLLLSRLYRFGGVDVMHSVFGSVIGLVAWRRLGVARNLGWLRRFG